MTDLSSSSKNHRARIRRIECTTSGKDLLGPYTLESFGQCALMEPSHQKEVIRNDNGRQNQQTSTC